MSDNSAWWLLIPVLCIGGSIATVVLTITLVVRRTVRGGAANASRFRPGGGGHGAGTTPLGPDWTPDGGTSSHGTSPHGGHVHGWGHDLGHHHSSHDPGASWSSSSDSGSPWSSSDSGSSSSSDSGSSSSSDSGSSSSSSSD